MDAMCFVFNRDTISQAGRRGFDPRLPLFQKQELRFASSRSAAFLPHFHFTKVDSSI